MGVVEILTRLTLDDQSSTALKHIQAGFQEVQHEETAATKAAGFFQQTLSTIIGMNFMEGIHKVMEFGESFVGLAEEESKFLKSNAAMMAAVDGLSFGKGMEEAEGFAKQLDDVAVQSGQTVDAVKEAFSAMNELTGAGANEMQANAKAVGDMSQVARVLGKDIGWLTSQFSLMTETGIVRPRSQLFLLLKGIGVFQGEAKAAAAAFGKMAEEDRVRLLTDGVGKLADKFRTIPLGFQDYVKSIKDVIELTKEDVGMPILKALTPAMHSMLDVIKQMRPLLVQLGTELASHVADVMRQLTGWMKDGLTYLSVHRREILQSIEEAVSKIKSVFEWVLSHKGTLAAMFAVKEFGPTAASGAGAAFGAARVAGGAMVAASGAGSASAFVGGVGGLAISIPIAAAATLAWASAIDQYMKYSKESDTHMLADANARKDYLQKLADTGGGFEKLTVQQREYNAEIARKFELDAKNYTSLGISAEEARRFTDASLHAVDAQQELVGGVNAAEDYFKNLKATQDAISQVDAGPVNDVVDVMQGLGAAFTQASTMANVGMQTHIATILSGSRDMQLAFLESAKLTSEGYSALADLLPKSAAEFKSELERKARGELGGDVGKGKGTNVSFNGGQTFKIQQDFRDQDPDRIAVLFNRGLLRSAEQRVQAATTSPFGT